MNIVTQTPRIIVREFLPEEENTYLNHFNDEIVLLYIPKRSREERIGIFHKALEQYVVDKQSGIWGIFNKADGGFMGSCLLRPFNNEPGKLELGYSLDRKHWGRRYCHRDGHCDGCTWFYRHRYHRNCCRNRIA